MSTGNCGHCGFYDSNRQVCLMHGISVDADNSCPKFNDHVSFCEICGRPVLQPYIEVVNDVVHLMCGKCCKALSTCQGCKHGTYCDFNDNPIAIEKITVKTVRQGNMVMQQQIPSPERIRETCEKNCLCFDKEIGCLRQFGSCGNQVHEW